MLPVRLQVGDAGVEFAVESGCAVAARVDEVPRPLPDVRGAARAALENPLGFPALRSALTPDDRVAIVVDEGLGKLAEILEPLVDHLTAASIAPERITLVCPPRHAGAAPPAWFEALQERCPGLRLEIHDPADRSKLAYLAGTRGGRPIYLNRTVIDADQIVVVGLLRYDPVMGYGGGLADVFPALGDEATRTEFTLKPTDSLPGEKPWPARAEVEEVGWLLGVPFLLLAVPAIGDDLGFLTGGLTAEAFPAARRYLDRHWSVRTPQSCELVVTAIAGGHSQQTWAHVTEAFFQASRLAQPGGRVAVLSRMRAEQLGPAGGTLASQNSLVNALAQARKQRLADAVQMWQLATAGRHGPLYLYADMTREAVEELGLVALDRPEQVQRLIRDARSCAFLQDAHRMMAQVHAE